MITNILHTFFQFFGVLMLFIIAFSLFFYGLLRNQFYFSTVHETIIKTMVMMAGEFDFTDMFFGNKYDRRMEHLIYFPISSYIVFVVFLVIMPIIIMNLLTALAVENVKHLKEVAYYESKKLEVAMCNDSEFYRKKNFCGQLIKYLKKFFKNYCCCEKTKKKTRKIVYDKEEIYIKSQGNDNRNIKKFNFLYKLKYREELKNMYNLNSSTINVCLFNCWAVECIEHNCKEDKRYLWKNDEHCEKEDKLFKKEYIKEINEKLIYLENSFKNFQEIHKKDNKDIKKSIFFIKNALIKNFE